MYLTKGLLIFTLCLIGALVTPGPLWLIWPFVAFFAFRALGKQWLAEQEDCGCG